MKKVLFFASVKDAKLFKLTGFYVEDIKVLEEAGFSVLSTNEYSSFLKFWKYDIAFLYFYKFSFIPALMARIFCKKIIYTGGIDELSENIIISKKRRIIFRFFFKLNYFLSHHCNIVSKEDLNNVTAVLNRFPRMSKSKLSYFPHSIDVATYSSSEIPTKENIITSICWMSTISNVQRKGVDRAIYLFKNIRKKHTDFKLYLIGSNGAGSDYLKEIIRAEGLEDSVIFTGSIGEDSKIELLGRSKYYLQLSTYEGFGLAVIEAMVLKNFIYHTGRGGLRDTIGDEGFIINDFIDYSDAIEFFEKTENNYFDSSKMLERNRKYVLDNFSTSSRSKYFYNTILN